MGQGGAVAAGLDGGGTALVRAGQCAVGVGGATGEGEGEVDGELGVVGGARTLRCGGVSGVCRVRGVGAMRWWRGEGSVWTIPLSSF